MSTNSQTLGQRCSRSSRSPRSPAPALQPAGTPSAFASAPFRVSTRIYDNLVTIHQFFRFARIENSPVAACILQLRALHSRLPLLLPTRNTYENWRRCILLKTKDRASAKSQQKRNYYMPEYDTSSGYAPRVPRIIPLCMSRSSIRESASTKDHSPACRASSLRSKRCEVDPASSALQELRVADHDPA